MLKGLIVLSSNGNYLRLNSLHGYLIVLSNNGFWLTLNSFAWLHNYSVYKFNSNDLSLKYFGF